MAPSLTTSHDGSEHSALAGGPTEVDCPRPIAVFGEDTDQRYSAHPSISYVASGQLHREGTVFEGFDLSESSEVLRLTPLVAAILTGCTEDALLLLELGADPTLAPAPSRSPASAAMEVDDAVVLSELIERGVDVETTLSLGESLLFVAVQESAEASLIELLARGADPTKSHLGMTVVEAAAANGWIEGVTLLADQPGVALDGALYGAIRFSQLETVELLFDLGASIDAEPPGVTWPSVSSVVDAATQIGDQAVLDAVMEQVEQT